MVLLDLLDLVLPVECGACRRPGSSWCVRCARDLRDTAFPDGPRRVRPDPEPAGLPAVHAWSPYAGPLRSAITAWKDEGRGDLTRVLAQPLAASVGAALRSACWDHGPVLVVPAPSTRRNRRRRGEVPLDRLTAAALAVMGSASSVALRNAPGLLTARRRIADQAGLDHSGRTRNLRGALAVDARWRGVVAGRRCLVVDDLVTTGATLVECSNALLEAGADGVVAATIGATERRTASAGRAVL